MSTSTKYKSAHGPCSEVPRIAFLLVFIFAMLPGLVHSANTYDPPPVNHPVPSDPGPRASVDRSGTLQTRDGLTLHLTTDVGSVHIVALGAGAPPVIRYTVHIETDARAPLAQSLLERYSLTAKATPYGVEIAGAAPSQGGRSGAGAQFYLQYEVAVPA